MVLKFFYINNQLAQQVKLMALYASSPFHIYSISLNVPTIPPTFYRFAHIQTRKPSYYHENSQRVSVIIQAVSVFV